MKKSRYREIKIFMIRHISYSFFLCFTIFSIISCSKSELLTTEEKQWLTDQDTINVALYPYYPPFQFINEKNEINGIFIDYLEYIERKIDYKFKRVHYEDWSQLLSDAKKNKIDLVLEIQSTPYRSKYFDFFDPLLESQHVIVTRKDVVEQLTIEDLVHKKLILPKGFSIVEELSYLNPSLDIHTAFNEIAALELLNAGKFDAYVGSKAMANYYIQYHKLENLMINGETPLVYRPSVATKKHTPIFNSIISKVVKDINKNDKKAILENWYFNSIVPFYKSIKFWVIVAIITSSLFLLIVASNTYLKFKIKQKTEELQIAKEVADESTKLKTSFINNIPQEIRTPMSGIIALSELLEDNTLSTEDRTKYTQMIISSSKTLISIIDNILELSKLQSNRFTLKLGEVNISKLLDTLHAFYQIQTQERGILLTVENKLGDHSNYILTDRPKLNKILHAIIDNAIKFTLQGSITITYEIIEQILTIAVQDTGIGISAEKTQLINESFSKQSISTTKELKGLGLGLIIAKKNADFLGGHIQLDSSQNEGSNFIIKIPYTPIKQNTTVINRAEKITIKKEKHIILIAEDGETNFLFLKTILSKMNQYEFIIYRAINGKEAVTICSENKNIDLVLMDIKMPIMNGYDATKYIKKMRPDLPVIAQTAYSVEEDIQKALDAGCDDFISKPVDKKILFPMLKKHFRVFKNN